MPNTNPVADNTGTITWIQEKAKAQACVNVLCSGAITKGLKGEELAPYGAMAAAGIVAITDDGHCVQNHEVMRRAVEYARMFGWVVLDHCQDYNARRRRRDARGRVEPAARPARWPRTGEEMIVSRNILLAELCDSPIHCQHISSGGSVRLIREARARGVKISGEVCPHHIALTDDRLQTFDSNFKMNPPLRTRQDIDLIIGGIADGTLDICAAIMPLMRFFEKEVELDHAPFGSRDWRRNSRSSRRSSCTSGRRYRWIGSSSFNTANPARLLSLDRGTLSDGRRATSR